jgi:hypothetical protein
MHKTLTKVKNKRLADLIEIIIKEKNKREILECVQFESSQLATQFKDPDRASIILILQQSCFSK